MDNGACGMCGGEGRLYVAPGGAMVCEQCLSLGHTINLNRLQGVSNEVLKEAWREVALTALERAEDHVTADCNDRGCVCPCPNCAPSGSRYCRAAWGVL